MKKESSQPLTPEQIERVGTRVRDFLKAASQDPELKKEALEKMAGINWSDVGGKALGGLAGAVGISAGLGLYNAAHKQIANSREEVHKARAYKEMLNHSPELQGAGVDAEDVQKHFNTLYRFNPEYAKDPVISASYVRNSIDMATPNMETINNMVRARSEMQRSDKSRQPAEELTKSVIPLIDIIGRSMG